MKANEFADQNASCARVHGPYPKRARDGFFKYSSTRSDMLHEILNNMAHECSFGTMHLKDKEESSYIRNTNLTLLEKQVRGHSK